MPSSDDATVPTVGEPFDALLAAARAGSPWAWERLYRDLAPVVVGYLRVQGSPEPEDLGSEVWLSILRGIGSFDGGERQFRSWVFVIAHRRLLDERRRAGRRSSPTVGAPAAVTVTAAEDDALRAISDDGVAAALSRLAPAQRDVLVLRILAGLTIEEISRVLGRSEGAVKALQRRGFDGLRRTFSVEGVPL